MAAEALLGGRNYKTLKFELDTTNDAYTHRRMNANNPAIRSKRVRRPDCRKPDIQGLIDDDGQLLTDADGDPAYFYSTDGGFAKQKSMDRNRKTTAERHELHRRLLMLSIWNHTLFFNEFLNLIGIRTKTATGSDSATSLLDNSPSPSYSYTIQNQREMVVDMFIFMLGAQYHIDVDKNIEDIVAIARFLFPLEPVIEKEATNSATNRKLPYSVRTCRKGGTTFTYTTLANVTYTLDEPDERVVSAVFRRKGKSLAVVDEASEEEIRNNVKWLSTNEGLTKVAQTKAAEAAAGHDDYEFELDPVLQAALDAHQATGAQWTGAGAGTTQLPSLLDSPPASPVGGSPLGSPASGSPSASVSGSQSASAGGSPSTSPAGGSSSAQSPVGGVRPSRAQLPQWNDAFNVDPPPSGFDTS